MTQNEQSQSAVVLVIDGLRSDALGPYGNTWLETPEFNRLAAQSALFEFATTDSPQLKRVYRSYWQGIHAMSNRTMDAGQSLAALLRQTHISTRLLTDSPAIADHPLAAAFDECELTAVIDPREAATDIAHTTMARLMAAAAERIAVLPERSLLWIHSRGMIGPWDAPTPVRHQFADEDDPLPPDFVEPPCRHLPSPADPDERLTLSHAYAGQVAVLDTCLGLVLDAIQARVAAPTWLIVTSPRGFPLGEHGRVGLCDESLYGEVLRVPLLVRFPNGDFAAARSQTFVQPADLLPSLLDWFHCAPRNDEWGRSLPDSILDESPPSRSSACYVSSSDRAIRTAAWFMRVASDNSTELFVKPDDHWEVNELLDRCRGVAEDLRSFLDSYQQAAEAVDARRIPRLDESLYLPPN